MSDLYQFAKPDGELDWSQGAEKFGDVWDNAKKLIEPHRGKGFRVRRRAPNQGWTRPYSVAELGAYVRGRLDVNDRGTIFDIESVKDGWKLAFRRHYVRPVFAPYDKETWRAQVTNGRIPSTLLAPIMPMQYDIDLGGPAKMHPEAAAAMTALLAAAPSGLAVKYSYRTLAKQQEKWANYLQGGNLAATPGTSNHGWGLAVDFTGLGWLQSTWLRANSRRFGFVNDVPGESWHYTYQGGWHA